MQKVCEDLYSKLEEVMKIHEGIFDNQLSVHDTFDSFCSVWNAVKEKWVSESIQRNYSDTWEYLRFAIRLVCIQLRKFFELCIEEKKSVLMIGI